MPAGSAGTSGSDKASIPFSPPGRIATGRIAAAASSTPRTNPAADTAGSGIFTTPATERDRAAGALRRATVSHGS